LKLLILPDSSHRSYWCITEAGRPLFLSKSFSGPVTRHRSAQSQPKSKCKRRQDRKRISNCSPFGDGHAPAAQGAPMVSTGPSPYARANVLLPKRPVCNK
jgi:hypothetical protein